MICKCFHVFHSFCTLGLLSFFRLCHFLFAAKLIEILIFSSHSSFRSRSSCGSREDLYDSLEDRHHSRQNNNHHSEVSNDEFEREGDKSRSISASSSTAGSFEVVDIGENGNGSDQGKNDNEDDSVLRKRK